MLLIDVLMKRTLWISCLSAFHWTGLMLSV